jgi:hypothetical protein
VKDCTSVLSDNLRAGPKQPAEALAARAHDGQLVGACH